MNFRGVSIDHLVFAENVIKHNIFIYDIDIEEGEIVGELARRSVEMYEKRINFLRSSAIIFAMLTILTRSLKHFVALVAIHL